MPPIVVSLAVAGAGLGLEYLLGLGKPKTPPTDKGKMDDVRVQGSDYGTLLSRLWGQGRQAGNVVWSNGVQTYVVDSPSSGGKGGGGGGPATRTYIYKTSLAVAIQRGPSGGGGITKFLQMWADADLINNSGLSGDGEGSFEAESATLSGGANVYTDPTASNGHGVQDLGNGGRAVFDFTSVVHPASPPNDPGQTAEEWTSITFVYKCTGFLNANITTVDSHLGTVSQSVGFEGSGTDWTAFTLYVPGFINHLTFDNPTDPAPDLDYLDVQKYWLVTMGGDVAQFKSARRTGVVNDNILYPPNLDDPSAYYDEEPVKDGTTGTYDITTAVPDQSIRFYTGTEAQNADSAIIAWNEARYGTGMGVLYTSAMRSIVYVLFEDYTMRGPSVPNFTFETYTANNTVNEIMADLFADVNLDSSLYDISATAGLSQLGFLENSQASRKTMIQNLSQYHFFRIAEIDGKIVTILDGGSSVGTIAQTSMRAHTSDQAMPQYDAEVVIADPNSLPREVRIGIMNPDLEYHNDVASAQLFTDISGVDTTEFDFPIVDSLDTARAVAEKKILQLYAKDKAVEWWGMPETAEYCIGDVITVPINGVNYDMQIEKQTATLPVGPIQHQCMMVQQFTAPYVQADTTALAPKASSQFARDSFPRNSVAFVIPSQPIVESDRGRLGVYVAVCGRGRGDGSNAALYRETAADNFAIHSIIDSPTPLGLAVTALATVASTTVEDDTNYLDIWFFDNISIESVLLTDINRSPTVNLIRVGDEWIQFRTAAAQTLEDNSPYRSKWRISNLWRGRFGTAAAVSTHAAGEYAAVVTPALKFVDLDAADIGQTVTLKAVTSGQDQSIAPVTSFTFAPVSSYTLSNVTPLRTLDANNVTENQLANIIGTIIEDTHI